MNSSLIAKMNNFTSQPINENNIPAIKNAKLINEGKQQNIYISDSTVANPQIGDIKINFEIIDNNGSYSIIAKQINNTFEKFYTSTGTSIEMIKPGIISTDNMFKEAQRSNQTTTWIFRFLGFFLMFFGLSLFFRPLVVLADVLPFLGSMLNMGLSLFLGLVAFALSFITIGVAWVVYRPLVGITLLAIALGLIIFAVLKLSKNKPAPVQTQSDDAILEK